MILSSLAPRRFKIKIDAVGEKLDQSIILYLDKKTHYDPSSYSSLMTIGSECLRNQVPYRIEKRHD